MDGMRGADAFEVVRNFLKGLGDRKPEPREVQQIAPALGEIFQRLMRVRSYAPRVDLSDTMWDLMAMVGIHTRRKEAEGPRRKEGGGWLADAAVL